MRGLALAIALAIAIVVTGCVTPTALDTAADPIDAVPSLSATVAYLADGSIVPLPAALTAVLRDVGKSGYEPTIGIDKDGAIYYTATDAGVAIGRSPRVMRSEDKGVTWTDVSPKLPTGQTIPPETNDPYLYVDPATSRIYQFPMAPILVCSVLSWSDNGGQSWTSNPHGCFTTPPWDHQTMVAAKARGAVKPVGYANMLHQCVNSVSAAVCSRSFDGGWTWTPGTPAFRGVEPGGGLCGGLHGHVVAAPDGTVYLPKTHCGAPMLAISRDDGATWQTVRVAKEAALGEPDPAVAVDAEGNVYYAYIDEAGALKLVSSVDAGKTWSEPLTASPPGVTAHIPAIAAGGAGKIALAYPGTPDLPDGYASESELKEARWNAYLTIVEDALAASPVFVTTRANAEDDPLVRGPCGPGRCPGMVDFIDVVIGPDGAPYASFIDVCADACATADGKAKDMTAAKAVLLALDRGPALT